MGFILENRLSDNRPDGWYAGQNRKYGDMFNYTAYKSGAYVFKNETDAQKRADVLNKAGYNFKVITI